MILTHNRPHLYMFVGLPGSGKTTFKKDILWKHSADVRPMTILSSDDYIEHMAQTLGKTYQEVFMDYVDDAQKALQSERVRAIKEKDHVLWDQTNLTPGTRRKKMSQFPKEYYKVALYFDTNHDIIDQVNQERHSFGRSIPDGIINGMKRDIVKPTLDEGFDTIITVER